MTKSEIAYGKTPLGQLLYDLAFTELSAKYLARKHHLSINKICLLRIAARKGLGKTRRSK